MFFCRSVFWLLVLFFLSLSLHAQEKDSSFRIVSEIKIIGNKTTKEHIVLRELPFNIGDTILASNLDEIIERSRSNLFITSLFNFVTIETAYFNDTYITFVITLEERWYWWPLPIFEIQETNFNTWWLDKNMDRVNYGMYVAKENFRGRKERLAFKFQGGYTEKVGFKYSVPYINQKQTQGIDLTFSYSRNREVNYNTIDNKRLFYKDENSYVKKQINTSFSYVLRPKLYNSHSFQFEYTNVDVVDSVLFLNNNFLSKNNNQSEFFSVTYYLKRDKRNNKAYPTQGYFYDFQLTQNGLKLLDEKINNSFLRVGYRKYLKIAHKTYWAGLIKGKVSYSDVPYGLLGGLGYQNQLVRGYEYYVVNGEHFGLFKTQLRYGIIEDKIFKIKPLPFEKFNKIPVSIYMGAFFDSGIISENKTTNNPNFLNKEWLYGGGFSIDFVSYYDMVFRMEYAFNKLNEQGLFIHFIAPL